MRRTSAVLIALFAAAWISCDGGGGTSGPGVDTTGTPDGVEDMAAADVQSETQPGDILPPEDGLTDIPSPGDVLMDQIEPDVVQPEDILPPEDTTPLACDTDDDCPGSQVCDPIPGFCVGCLFEHQCEAGSHCVGGDCIGFTTCMEDGDCPEGLVCAQDLMECVPCVEDAQCEDLPATSYCDGALHLCVECLESAHCAEAFECLAGACVPYLPCASSKDCEEGICWTEMGKCVDCVEQVDCDEGTTCVDSVCEPTCDSDKDCKDQNMVCDKDLAVCADCVGNEDCPDVYNCLTGVCVLDLCQQGIQLCDGPTVKECNEVGDGFEILGTCEEGQTCKQDGETAACMDIICPPGQMYCTDENHAIVCSTDGLEILSDEDCEAESLVCEMGACEHVICEPGAEGCDETGFDKVQCSPLGTQWLPVPCPEASYCEPNEALSTALCLAQICAPGEPACLGNLATTCNDNGSDVLPGGEDCGDLTCIGGECAECVNMEICDGLDNDCDGEVDNNPADCDLPSECFFGTCYSSIEGANCWVKKYGGHVYMACYKTNTNAIQAAEICADWHGSHLVVLNDADEEQFILANVSGPTYIGYSDEAEEGDWVWALGDNEHENWCPGQPDDWDGNEDCCMMKSNVGGQNNCWNDVDCAAADNRFVCEVEGP